MAVLSLVVSMAYAGEPQKKEKIIPEKIDGVMTISADELASMLASDPNLHVFDARISKGRKKGYIEGSIHLSDINTNCESLAKIAPVKQDKVVFYCSSSKCGRSLNAVTIAQKCNYKNLYWFRGGFKEWKRKKYPYKK